MTNVAYFTLRDGMGSTLTLQNLAPTPTSVTVTIFNPEGWAHQLDPMTLDPHSVTPVNLVDVVPHGDFDSGNIEVAYHGISMAVTCQVSISATDKRVSFESREQDMMDFESAKLDGILWLPQPDAEGYLALTNVAPNKITAQLSVGPKTEEIPLASRQTRLIKLKDEFGQHAPVTTLIKLQHNGLPGDIITTGYVVNLKTGYSSGLPMVDPGIMRSSHLAGTHFRFGPPDPNEGFPAGTQFRSPLLLANVSDKTVTAHVSVDYSVEDKTPIATPPQTGPKLAPPVLPKYKVSNLPVADVVLNPGSVQSTELSSALTSVDAKMVSDAGVDIDYDASPGAIIGQLTSLDQTGDYSFEVPIKDPKGMDEMIEGIYPWTLENGTKTVLHLKNTTDKSVNAFATLSFTGGNYNLDPITLQPYQTVAIDIQKLKDSKKRDVLGQTVPVDVTHGQFVWRRQTPYTMIGRAEQINPKAGTASSFSCETTCCDYFWEDVDIDGSSSLSGPVGGSDTITATRHGANCTGYPFSDGAQAYAPSSDNSDVATFSWSYFTGYVDYVGAGTTNVREAFDVESYAYGSDGFCDDGWNQVQYFEDVTVAVPTNFRQASVADIGDGVLQFHYAWDSTSGNLADLNGCQVGEIVTYPGGNPYFWPSPPFPANSNDNPFVADVAAQLGLATDTHLHGSDAFVRPYSTSSFTATQFYRYICPGQSDYTNLVGPNNIERDVLQNDSLDWRYDVTKSGAIAILTPLP